MNMIRIREFERLEYRDPQEILVRLRQLEQKVVTSELPAKVRNLRMNPFKPWREMREAALFCYGMGERIGSTVYFALKESQDYDFVASWVSDCIRNYAPVQIKEVVPEKLN